MKKTLFFSFITAVVMLSCNDDESPSTPQNSDLVGQWELTAWYDDVARDIDGDGNASTDLYAQWNGCYKYSIITFNADNSTRFTYTGANENPRCSPDTVTGTSYLGLAWQIQQTDGIATLVFDGDDYWDPYEIVELTDTVLVLKGSQFLTCCDSNINYFTDGYLKFEKK